MIGCQNIIQNRNRDVSKSLPSGRLGNANSRFTDLLQQNLNEMTVEGQRVLWALIYSNGERGTASMVALLVQTEK